MALSPSLIDHEVEEAVMVSVPSIGISCSNQPHLALDCIMEKCGNKL